ncbi:hypothetical protein MERGE_001529 [Pneumocystis wakefieldiae]|uniref:Small ribosomal subunit protein mS33 n=1 Tax=Pneumocystis wakefieldiae TaxID=38082 RepID=A0A899FTC8_9ASCO|nr:hypothetical protein MERGE_001529 [Pneumocystis wakefieldiae]
MGNRVLLRRFPGSSVSQYYPGFNLTKKSLIRSFPGLNLVDPDELERIQWVERRKRRGKGPPPKSKFKTESKSRKK